jgi:hypothetical protein
VRSASDGAPTGGWPSDPRPSWPARLTSPWRCLPDLLVIGAQKSGTTSLHAHLDRHPSIWMTPWKECNFFTGRPRSALAYRSFFLRRAERRARDVLVVGESTPYYLFHPAVPRRASARLPGVRAIAVLRDPVERAWSHYRHNVRLGLEPLSFGDALDAETERTAGELERVAAATDARSDALRHYSYAARGRYAEQLRRWLEALGRDRVHVMIFEDLVARPRETMADVARFLAVADRFGADLPDRNRDEASAELPEAVRRRLRDEFAEPNRDLAALLGIDVSW